MVVYFLMSGFKRNNSSNDGILLWTLVLDDELVDKFYLLKELISSIKRFSASSNVSIGVLDGGLNNEQIEFLKKNVDHVKKAKWDIPVNKVRVRGRCHPI